MWEKIVFKWLWLKHYWRFNFAHKPLCSNFHSDVIHIFGGYFCRSCTLAYTGIISSICYFLILEPTDGHLTFYISLLLLTVLFSLPKLYKKLPRFIRDVLRFNMGFLIPHTIYIIVVSNAFVGGVAAICIFVFWRYYFHQRKKRKLSMCNGCPEYRPNHICSGFTNQVEAIKHFQEEATDWKLRNGYKPNIKGIQ
jgi:hypothetical protein